MDATTATYPEKVCEIIRPDRCLVLNRVVSVQRWWSERFQNYDLHVTMADADGNQAAVNIDFTAIGKAEAIRHVFATHAGCLIEDEEFDFVREIRRLLLAG